MTGGTLLVPTPLDTEQDERTFSGNGFDFADLGAVLARDDEDEILRFPKHIGLLEDALAQTAARLVVIDPVMAFLDQGAAANSDQCVRRALAPLARLVDKYGAAVLLVRHLNKSGDGRALYRGSGFPDIDAEALAAVKRAEPFPPPPPGTKPHLVATIEFKE